MTDSERRPEADQPGEDRAQPHPEAPGRAEETRTPTEPLTTPAPEPTGPADEPRIGSTTRGTAEPVSSAPGRDAPAWAPTTTWSTPGTDATTTVPATSPVVAPARRPTRARWIVALLATALVAVIVAGLLLFVGGPAPSGAPAYMPANTFVYGEARLDLPGDQRQKMAQFLSHFPGFKDQTTLERKIDETLDRVFREGSKNRYSYTGDIKPWFGGQVSFAFLDVPEMTGSTATPPVLAVLSVTDRAKAEATLTRLREDAKTAGVSFKSEDYKGTTIWSVDASAPRAEGFPATGEYALATDALLISSQPGGIKAALDRKTGSGDSLAKSNNYVQGQAGVRDDRVAMFYVGTQALKASLERQLTGASPAPGSQFIRDTIRTIPDRISGSARVEPDRIVVETRSDLASGATAPTLRESPLALRVPATSAVFIETPNVGQGIGRLVTQLKSDPQFQQMAPQVEQIELVLGNKLESYLDWLGDVAVVGESTNGRPNGGLVATVSNEEVAVQRIGQLTQLMRLGGAQAGGQIAVRDEDHGGTKITTISISTGGTFDAFGQRLEDVDISFAFKQGLFVLGTGDYVKRILDLPPNEALGQSQRFKDAVAAAGGPNTAGVSYVDVGALRTAAEALLDTDDRTRYETEYKPYLEPIDRIVSATVTEGNTLVSRSVFIVK